METVQWRLRGRDCGVQPVFENDTRDNTGILAALQYFRVLDDIMDVCNSRDVEKSKHYGGSRKKRRFVRKVNVSNSSEIETLLSLPTIINHNTQLITQQAQLTQQHNYLTHQLVNTTKNKCYGIISFLNYYHKIRPGHRVELALITSDFIEFHNSNMKARIRLLTSYVADCCDAHSSADRLLTYSDFVHNSYKRSWHHRKASRYKENALEVADTDSSEDCDESEINENSHSNDNNEGITSEKSGAFLCSIFNFYNLIYFLS
jgi:hypothetical protein